MRSDYDERRKARVERLERRADKARENAANAGQRSRDILDPIPLGQPILVGHHSEAGHRRALRRADDAMRRSVEEGKRAEELERRAAAAANNHAIFADDPEAVAKLREKIAMLEARQAEMKALNTAYRKGDAAMAALGWTPEQIKRLRDEMAKTPYERQPHPAFELSNNNANLKRLQKRLKRLEALNRTADEEIPFTDFGGGRLVLNATENRVQIFFDEEPSPEKRHEMKRRHGFRFASSITAWQRHYSANAIHWAKVIVGLPTNATAPTAEEARPLDDAADDTGASPDHASTDDPEENTCLRCGREADPVNPLRRIVFLDENGNDTDRELDACYSCFELYVTERGMARAKSEVRQ